MDVGIAVAGLRMGRGMVGRAGVVGMDPQKAVVDLAVVAVDLEHEPCFDFAVNPSSRKKKKFIN